MATEGELVQLWIYDLSGGLARLYSQMLLGKQIEAIYHTSIVVGGLEHFFGGGISVVRAGTTPFGQPMQKVDLGRTQLPEDIRAELLAELSERYTPQAYSLFHNNCNSFSNELAQLLCGTEIPPHITSLPSEVLSTPFGQMIAPMLNGLEGQLRAMRSQGLDSYLPAAAAPAPAAVPAAPVEPAQLSTASGGEEQAPERAGEDAPALHAAEVEIEAAVAAGMMRDAERSASAAAPAEHAASAKLAAELELAQEFERLMATGTMAEHEAQAAAMEAAAARRQQEQEHAGQRSEGPAPSSP